MLSSGLNQAPTSDPEINAAIAKELHNIGVEQAQMEIAKDNDPFADDDEYTVFSKLGEGATYVKDIILRSNSPRNKAEQAVNQ